MVNWKGQTKMGRGLIFNLKFWAFPSMDNSYTSNFLNILSFFLSASYQCTSSRTCYWNNGCFWCFLKHCSFYLVYYNLKCKILSQFSNLNATLAFYFCCGRQWLQKFTYMDINKVGWLIMCDGLDVSQALLKVFSHSPSPITYETLIHA